MRNIMAPHKDNNEKQQEKTIDEMTRREALIKLGLVTAITYVSPLLLKLNEAHAKSGGSSGWLFQRFE